MVTLDRASISLGSLLFVLTFVGVARTAAPPFLNILLIVGSLLAVVLSVPVAALGIVYAGRYDVDRALRRGVGVLVGVALVATVLFAALVDPGVAPLVGAGVLALGLFWHVAPLAVGAVLGAWWGVSFRRILLGWPPSAVLGGLSVVAPGGLFRYNLTVLAGPIRVAVSVAVFLVVVCGPSVIGLAITRVRGSG